MCDPRKLAKIELKKRDTATPILTRNSMRIYCGDIVAKSEVVGVIVSVGSAVVDVEEVSEGVSEVNVDSPSTAGVDVELTNGGELVMYEPSACTA